jgi:predicted DCC family thiol-disulfide oxidoreductase YuxK
LIRHAATEAGLGDPAGFTLGQCRTQRNLSEAGRQASQAFGAWLKAQNFKPDAVLSSQWCRCQDTARLAFGQFEDWPALNSTFAGQGDPAAQQKALLARLRGLPPGLLGGPTRPFAGPGGVGPMSGLHSLTVYFDGSCPMCRREIAIYRRLPQAAAVDWVDVSAGAELGASLSCAQAMARFHVRDRQGRLYSGAAAFSKMWRMFPGWRWLGWLSAWPPLSWLFEAAYRLFLPLRPSLQKWVRRSLGEETS